MKLAKCMWRTQFGLTRVQNLVNDFHRSLAHYVNIHPFSQKCYLLDFKGNKLIEVFININFYYLILNTYKLSMCLKNIRA